LDLRIDDYFSTSASQTWYKDVYISFIYGTTVLIPA